MSLHVKLRVRPRAFLLIVGSPRQVCAHDVSISHPRPCVRRHPVDLSVYLCIYLSTYVSICLPMYLSVYVSVYLCIHPSIYLPNLTMWPKEPWCMLLESSMYQLISIPPQDISTLPEPQSTLAHICIYIQYTYIYIYISTIYIHIYICTYADIYLDVHRYIYI